MEKQKKIIEIFLFLSWAAICLAALLPLGGVVWCLSFLFMEDGLLPKMMATFLSLLFTGLLLRMVAVELIGSYKNGR